MQKCRGCEREIYQASMPHIETDIGCFCYGCVEIMEKHQQKFPPNTCICIKCQQLFDGWQRHAVTSDGDFCPACAAPPPPFRSQPRLYNGKSLIPCKRCGQLVSRLYRLPGTQISACFSCWNYEVNDIGGEEEYGGRV